MAKQIENYADKFGNVYPASYWRILTVEIDVANRQCSFTFNAYKDAQARLDGKLPIPGAFKPYTVEGAEFDALYARHLQGENLPSLMYEFATNDLDCTRLATPEEAGPDEVHPIISIDVSFFDGAQDV